LNDAGSGCGLNDSGLGNDSGGADLVSFCSSRGALEGICGLGSGAETGAFDTTEGAENDSFVATTVFSGSGDFLAIRGLAPWGGFDLRGFVAFFLATFLFGCRFICTPLALSWILESEPNYLSNSAQLPIGV
jgi:hypothetical protein